MKKFVKVAVVSMLIAMSMTGCGEEPVKEVNTQEAASVEVEKPNLREIAPDPEAMFPDADFEITDPESGTSYQFILKNGTREMFEAYREECRDGSFSEYVCDIENVYKAYTPEGLYYISVNYFPGTEDDPTNAYVYVSVEEVEK